MSKQRNDYHSAKTIKVEADVEDENQEAVADDAAAPAGADGVREGGIGSSEENMKEGVGSGGFAGTVNANTSVDGPTVDGADTDAGEVSDVDAVAEDAAAAAAADDTDAAAGTDAAADADAAAADTDAAADENAADNGADEKKGDKADSSRHEKKQADQIEKLTNQLAEAREKYARLQAEWDNYRKRTAAERLSEKDRATEKLVKNILPVLDDLERALEHADGSDKQAFLDGIAAVASKFSGVLASEGVEVIDPAGKPYDVNRHQAVGTEEDADVPHDTVKQVYQKGYAMGDKIIRPAMVTVSTGGPDRPKEE